MAIGGINLNRFNGMTRRYLEQPQPNLQFFSVSGNRTQATNGSLNANSSFTIPATEFTPAYDVNKPPTRPIDYGHYLAIRPDTRFLRNPSPIESRPVSEAENFNRPLNIGYAPASSNGFRPHITTGQVPAVAPEVPAAYQERIQYFSISDANFDTLRNQPEFRIPQNGMGFKVFTDGAGNIDRIETSPSAQGRLPRFGATADNFGLSNRFDITNGATFTVNPVPAREIAGRDGINPNQPANRLDIQDFLTRQLQELQGQEKLQGLFGRQQTVNPLENANPFAFNLQTNPVLDRLKALQPQETGIAVAGADSEVDLTTARQIAANKAKFDVNVSDSFARNLKGLQNAAIQQGHLYSPAKHAAELTGSIPMAPSLPAPSKPATESIGFAGLSRDAGMGLNPDTMEKKGSGGYIPFRMGGDGAGQQQPGGDFFGFGGGQSQQQQQHQQQQQRRPLFYNA